MSVRREALQILKNVSSGAFLSEELNKSRSENIALLRNITTGSLRNKTYLDYLIKKNSKIRFKKIHEDIRIILEMSLYQYIFLDGIPDYTIVDEAVKLTKKISHKGSVGFVNGLLRNFMRTKDFEVDLNGKDYYLTRYSVPEKYFDYLEKNYSKDKLEEILKLNNTDDNFTIRANFTKLTRDELIKSLGVKYNVRKDMLTKSGIIVEDPKDIFKTDEFKNGKFYVQDSGSILISELLNPKEDSLVLDMCANPGGKTTHLLEILNKTGRVLAWDIKDMVELRENAKRLGLSNLEIETRDATIYDEKYNEKFDYVLLDAPCSAIGLIRRHPEIRYKEVDLESITCVQEKLLDNAGKYLKPGGLLMYSTCSVLEEENENIVDKFLEKNRDFEKVKTFGKDTFKTDATMEADGFSISLLRRI